MEEGVKHDLEIVRKSPYLRKELKDSVRGFIFDIKTGLLNPVLWAIRRNFKEVDNKYNLSLINSKLDI